MDSPFTFSSANPRVVCNVAHSKYVMPATGVLWLFSMYKYQSKFFRVDKNAAMAGAFALLALPASYSYARFFLGSAEMDAAQWNNDIEGALSTVAEKPATA